MSNVAAYPNFEANRPQGSQDQAQAFRDLEELICDLLRMAEISHDLVGMCLDPPEPERQECLARAMLAVGLTRRLTSELKEHYYRQW